MAKTSAWCSTSKTFEYRPAAKPALPALEMAKNAATLPERLRLLLANDPAKDKAARFLWPFLASLWNFAAERIGEVADDAPSIDRAMRAGFNWELGPFEMWDAAGVADTVARMKALRSARQRSRARLCSRPRTEPGTRPTATQCFQPVHDASRSPFPPAPATPAWPSSARSHGVIRRNAGASLVDLGDGIGCIELHSLKNAIGGDVVALVSAVLNPASDAVRDFAGFVITGDRDNFSVGANLMQLLLAAQEGEWDEVDARHSRLPADDRGHQVLSAPGGGGALRPDPRRRRGDLPARRAPPAPRGDLHRPGRGRRRPDSRRRRDQGDAAARRRRSRRAGAARSA